MRMTIVDDPVNVRYVIVKGHVRQWLKDNGVPAMWLPRHRGFCMRRDRLPDLLALADVQGHRVRVIVASEVSS